MYPTITPLLLLLCAAAYLIGSVPFGYFIAKASCGRNPLLEGSCNVGATNVARLCGLPFGILTLVCDVLKGLLPTGYALILVYPDSAGLVGFCALLGHMYSVFLRFRGGKAVATTIGVFIPLCFPALLISAALCLAVIGLTRLVSLGSLTLAASLPICLAAFGRWDIFPIALLIAIVIFFKHRANIKRLLNGTEKKLGQRT